MNNRNYEIKVRLTQAEMVHLNRLVNGSKLSREAYLRAAYCRCCSAGRTPTGLLFYDAAALPYRQ